MNSQFTGHTPGPWEWDSWHQIQNVFYAHELCALDGSFVLETTNPQNGRVLMVMSRSDARLIAAAPDLLAENQQLREEKRKADTAYNELWQRYGDLEDERDRLQEAIKTHCRNLWGNGPIGHHEDAALYDTLKEKS